MLYDGSTSCVATSVYNHEIKAGDFVTWEVTLNGEAASTKLSLQPIITFREIEQESSTHKWVSGAGGPKTDMMDEEDGHETTLDVTLPCQSTTTSPIKALLLCPLVYFAGLNREKVIGDTASFEYLWQSMEEAQIMFPFTLSDGEEGRTGKVHVPLFNGDGDVSSTGYAFMDPAGRRIFCIHQVTGGLNNVLHVRSDSLNLLETLVGTDVVRTEFLRFIFEANSSIIGGGGSDDKHKRPDIGHDFPSMTMPCKPRSR